MKQKIYIQNDLKNARKCTKIKKNGLKWPKIVKTVISMYFYYFTLYVFVKCNYYYIVYTSKEIKTKFFPFFYLLSLTKNKKNVIEK